MWDTDYCDFMQITSAYGATVICDDPTLLNSIMILELSNSTLIMYASVCWVENDLIATGSYPLGTVIGSVNSLYWYADSVVLDAIPLTVMRDTDSYDANKHSANLLCASRNSVELLIK